MLRSLVGSEMCIRDRGIYCNDGHKMDFKDIKKYFDGERCPELLGKPKLFFVQACQGNEQCGWGQLARDSPLIPNGANNNVPIPDELGEIDDEESKEKKQKAVMLASDADFLFYVASTPGKMFICFDNNFTLGVQIFAKINVRKKS